MHSVLSTHFPQLLTYGEKKTPNHYLFLNITTYGLNYKTQDEGHSDAYLDSRKAFLASLHEFIHSTFIPVSLDKTFPRKIKNFLRDGQQYIPLAEAASQYC